MKIKEFSEEINGFKSREFSSYRAEESENIKEEVEESKDSYFREIEVGGS